MFVRCIDDKNSKDLLKNEQVYKVIDTTETDYVIMFTNNKSVYFRKSRFIVEEQR